MVNCRQTPVVKGSNSAPEHSWPSSKPTPVFASLIVQDIWFTNQLKINPDMTEKLLTWYA